MPRTYKPDPTKRRYKKYDQDIINKAVEEYLICRQGNLGEIAKKYGIHKSVLYRHSTRNMKPQGGQRALSDEAERYLIENINKCAEWGYLLDVMDLRYLIKMYLDKIGICHKTFKNIYPGPDFIQFFLKRHKNEISQRICENIKRVRAKVSPDTIKEYFKELEKSLDGVPASNVINYDETNLSDDPGRKKILVKRGCKYPERVMNHTKSSVSIMMAGTADGKMLPPYVVYKATHLYDTWIEQGPAGARYNRSDSGWFDGTSFQDWVENLVIPFFKDLPGKKCLIGDNLSSHFSADLIQKCENHDINFVFLPANSTHLTQPLDVAFFRPMKRAWRELLFKWKKSDGRLLPTVPKGCFPKLLKLLIDELSHNSSQNIISGFRKTGIVPLDINQVLTRLPDGDQDDNDHLSAVTDYVLDLLKEMRYGSMNITEPKRKRKLNVVAGKSVSFKEIEDYIESGPSGENKKKKNNDKNAAKKTKMPDNKTKATKEKERSNDSNVTAHKQITENHSSTSDENNIKKNKRKGIGKKTKRTVLNIKEQEEKENHNTNMLHADNEKTENQIFITENICAGRINEESQHEIYTQETDMNVEEMPFYFVDNVCEEIIIDTETNEAYPKDEDILDNVNEDITIATEINETVAKVNEGKEMKTKKNNIISEEILNPANDYIGSKQLQKKTMKRSKNKKTINNYNNKDEILKILEDDSN